MLFGGGLFGFVLLAFWVWAIFDVITTDEASVRHLPKFAWLLLVILLSTIGALAWLLLGRPARADGRVGRVGRVGPMGPIAGPAAESAASVEEARRARYAAFDEELDRRLEEKRRRGEEN